MPNQDYDINPQQTESPKSPNRINPALMPPIPNLPKAIVGSSGGNVAPQINAHPQNAQFSMEDIKRMIEVNYMMRNYEKESLTYPNNLLAPYYLTEYIKTKNVSVYTKNTLLSLGEYVKNSTNKQPRRKDIIDFLARTVVSHNNIFPDIPMDQKGIVSLISDVENFFSWTFENRYYDDVARNIYYDDVMARVTQISQQPANVAQQQANGQPVFNKNWINVYLKYIENKKTNAITKADIKDSTKQTIKYIISTLIGCLTLSSGGSKQIQPTLSNILDIFIVYEKKMQYKTIQNYLHTYQELFRWTATEARKKGIYYPNIIGENVPGKRILENVIGKLRNLYNQNQIDQTHPTLKYFEKFEQACPKKDDGTNDDSLENFIEFLQHELHINENHQQIDEQPTEVSPQQANNQFVFKRDWIDVYLEYIKNKKIIAKKNTNIKNSTLKTTQAAIHRLMNYLNPLKFKQIQPTSSNILDYFIVDGNTTLYKTIQNHLHTYQELFRWTATEETQREGIYYPNIIGEDVPKKRILESVIVKLRDFYNKGQLDQTHPTLKYFEKFEQVCPKKSDGTKANDFGNFIEFLQYELHLQEKPQQDDIQLVIPTEQSQQIDDESNLGGIEILSSTPPNMTVFQQIDEQPTAVSPQQANKRLVFKRDWINVYLDQLESTRELDNSRDNIRYIIVRLINFFHLDAQQIKLNSSYILDFLILNKLGKSSRTRNYLYQYQDLFRWTTTKEAQRKNIYYPDIIGNIPNRNVLKSVMAKVRENYNPRTDKKHPSAKYFEKFEQVCPKKSDGTKANDFGNFVEFLQYELHLKERPPQANTQPVTEAQQPIQNGILTPQDFMDYINSVGLSQQAKNILQSFGNYINRSSGKATREHVVEWIGHNVAYKNYSNPDNPMNDDQIQKVIDHIKSFFNWTEQKLTYNNIAHDIVVEEIKNRANMLLNDPLTIQEMKATRSKSSKQQPATANTPNLETNITPPTIRPTIQPPKISPSDLKGLQENLKRLQPQNRENPIPKVNLGTHENFDLSSISQFTQLYDPLENLSNLSDIDRHTPLPDNNQIHEMNNNGIHQQVGNEPDPEGDNISFDYLYPEIGPDPFSPDYDLQYDDYY